LIHFYKRYLFVLDLRKSPVKLARKEYQKPSDLERASP